MNQQLSSTYVSYLLQPVYKSYKHTIFQHSPLAFRRTWSVFFMPPVKKSCTERQAIHAPFPSVAGPLRPDGLLTLLYVELFPIYLPLHQPSTVCSTESCHGLVQSFHPWTWISARLLPHSNACTNILKLQIRDYGSYILFISYFRI